MGGFTKPITELAAKGISELGAKLGKSAVADEAAKAMTNFMEKNTNIETTLGSSKEADYIRSLLADHKDATNKMIGPVQQNLAQHFPTTPANKVSVNMIRAKASELSETSALGKNRQDLILGMQKFKEAHGDIRARNLADQLGVHLRETSYPIQTTDYGMAETSRLAHQLSTHPKTKFATDPATGLPQMVKDPRTGEMVKQRMDWGKSIYQPPGEVERKFTRALTTPLMQRVGILHAVGGKLNLLLDSNLQSTMKVIGSHFTQDRAGWVASRRAIGALSEYGLEKHQQLAAFENRKIPLPDNAFWRGARGNFLSLGLSFAKKDNIIDFGMQGEFEAKHLAKDLFDGYAANDLKKIDRAKYWLKVYGLDGDDILSHGFLSDDHIATAIDKNIERKLMIDTKNLRWIRAQATPWGRIVRTFNGYKTGQRNFLLQAFKHSIHDAKGGNPMALLTFMGSIGLAFPDVGAALRYGTDLWTGKNERESREKMTDVWTYKKFREAENGADLGKAFMDQIDAAMHFTAVGMLISHNRYYEKTRFLEEAVGPVVSNFGEQVGDVASAFYHGFDDTSRRQLMRDVLHDIPAPIIGQYLSGKIFPAGSGRGGGGGGGRPKPPTRPKASGRPRRPS